MAAGYNTWRADRFTFTVSGRGAQRLFTQAAQQGIPLSGLRCTAGGYAAGAQGRDLTRLRALAERGGWQFAVVRRRGPGRLVERLLHRPGLPLGLALCAALLHVLAGFVWAMDLSALNTDADRQHALRGLLDENGIREGSYLTQAQLQKAQQALSLHSDDYGWQSLNFAGGCLYVETAVREQHSVQPAPQNTALYAKTAGEVLAVRVNSGFAAVTPGQYVAAGQLLAAAVRADHSGGPVTQAASGQVLARAEIDLRAAQPLQTQTPVLTGRSQTADTLCLLGRQWALHTPEESYPAAQTADTWLPLRLGRLPLPGSLHRTTRWELQDQTLTYSEETAAAMARRACRLLLAEQFPDAVVEAQALRTVIEGGQAVCTAHYVFTADIAAPQLDRGEYAS